MAARRRYLMAKLLRPIGGTDKGAPSRGWCKQGCARHCPQHRRITSTGTTLRPRDSGPL